MRIIWRSQARIDLRQSIAFIGERNTAAAVRIYDLVQQRVNQLNSQPNMGRPGRVADTRELVITGTVYIVAYTVDMTAQTVIILRVMHAAQEWPDLLGEQG